MRGERFRTALLGAWVVLILSCGWAFAQAPETPAGNGPYRITLADVKACLKALDQAEKTLAGQEAVRAGLAEAAEVLRQAQTTASAAGDRSAIPAAFAANLAAGPYVQIVSETSVVIRWAAIDTETVVRYGKGGRLTSTAEATRLILPRRMYEATLTGLESGAEYVYAIRAGGKEVRGRFRAAPTGDAPFTFAVWGDSQCYPSVFSGVARQMAKQEIDLAICTGDAVEVGMTDGDYYWEFFQPAQEVLRNTLLLSVVGNHELFGDADLARHRRLIGSNDFGRNFFAVTYANCRFIVLDSNDKGLFGGAQLEWLKQELASEACVMARFRFLLLHHAPFCWDWYGGEQQVQQVVVPLAEKHKVDVLFAGHFHCYERGARATDGHQTWYVVTGGGGGPFTDERNGPGHHERDFMVKHAWKYHFVLVQVDDRGLRARAIDDQGGILDEFGIEKPAGGKAVSRSSTPVPQGPGSVGPATNPAGREQPPGLLLSEDEVRDCTISAADRTAALTALNESLKGLAPRTPAARVVAQVAAVLAEAPDVSQEGTWDGPVERTAHHVPRLVNKGIHYRLKPSERAGAGVKQTLDGIAASKLRGTFQATGLHVTDGPLHWILVDSIVAK